MGVLLLLTLAESYFYRLLFIVSVAHIESKEFMNDAILKMEYYENYIFVIQVK